MQNDKPHLHSKILDFYTENLKTFGESSKGVGWRDDTAQIIRFEQLSKLIDLSEPFTVNDLGCGTGKFYDFLKTRMNSFSYFGYDILDEMIDAAARSLPKEGVTLKKITSAADLLEADYTVASGIFNVRYDAEEETWLGNILETLKYMNTVSKKGIAFNCLTKYSDADRMQAYLYYADPLVLFDFCKRQFSKNVALLHDYNQYDFTIIVKK